MCVYIIYQAFFRHFQKKSGPKKLELKKTQANYLKNSEFEPKSWNFAQKTQKLPKKPQKFAQKTQNFLEKLSAPELQSNQSSKVVSKKKPDMPHNSLFYKQKCGWKETHWKRRNSKGFAVPATFNADIFSRHTTCLMGRKSNKGANLAKRLSVGP